MLDLFYAEDDSGKQYPFVVQRQGNLYLLTLKKEIIQNVKLLRVLPVLGRAETGDDGYYILSRNLSMVGDIQIFFNKHKDSSYRYGSLVLSLYGIKKSGFCCIVRIERNHLYKMEASCLNGIYNISAVFDFERSGSAQQDIRLEIIILPEYATYSDMAIAERERRLVKGEIHTIRDKCRKREVVEYARKYPLIRIRMGWKPSPALVVHQTPETEPPMHIACTFADIRRIADELKKQDVEGAELQLVGWNISGHDGRFPQLFPADERLGGDEEFRKTINYVKQLGYRISTHTNVIDAYEIADTFTWDDIVIQKNGKFLQIGHYSGGYAYHVCLKKQLKNTKRDLPILAEYGENGLHFTDVISIVEPDPCFSTDHPCSFAEGIETAQKIMAYTSGLFGGFSSEGCYDFALDYIDYGLYVTFGDSFKHTEVELCDRYLPFFEMIYHGIVLYNPMSATVNYNIQKNDDRLRFILRGGRPTYYFYSKFRTGGEKNWMGDDDLTCQTDDELKRSVASIKKGLDEYSLLADKQLMFINNYKFPEDKLEVAEYSDGSSIVGNFDEVTRNYKGHSIAPHDYILLYGNT